MANTRGEKSLGELIGEAHVATGSLRVFAKKLGITPSYMSDIEDDRRTPAEDVLKVIAQLLGLEFYDLMARARRFGDDTDRYMRRHPTAGVLFRQISEANLADDDLVKLFKKAEELGRKKDQET